VILTRPTLTYASEIAQRAVLRILHDEYSVFSARVVEAARLRGCFVWYMRGECPYHRREHRSNRWSIKQFDNNHDWCLFHCFHGDVKKNMVYLPIDWYTGDKKHLADLLTLKVL